MSEDVVEKAEPTTEVTQPIIIDLGKQKRKRIKKLKQGRGKLWNEVIDVIEEVKYRLGDEADGKTIVPVVMVYRQKSKSRRIRSPFF